MIKRKRIGILLAAFILSGCFQDKMPLTTSSEKARDYYLIGLDLSERLRRKDAAEYFQKAIAADTNFAFAYLNLALTHGSTKDFLHNFYKAVEKSENASEAEQLWIKGWEYRVNGLPAKAEITFRKLVEQYPEDERVLNMLGTHLFTQQAYEEAINYYLEAVRINPEFSQPYNQLGYCYRYLGNYIKAEDAFKKYIKMIPDDPNPYDSYAELLLTMGEYEVSIEMYEKSLELDPDFASPYIGIATNLNLKHEHKEARKQLMDLFRRADNDVDRRHALIAMVVSCVDEENYEKAIEILKKCITLSKEQGDMAEMASNQRLLAYLLLEFGRTEKSIEAFWRARELVEQSELSEEIKTYARQSYAYGKARISIAKGDLATADSALKEYRKNSEANENPGMIRSAHELAGLIAMERQNYQEAISEFEQANQQDPYTFYRIAEAYLKQNDQRNALEYYQKAAQFNALNSINYALIRRSAVRKALRIKSQLSSPLSFQLQSVGQAG